jgi:arginine-tRNA-protein transferase
MVRNIHFHLSLSPSMLDRYLSEGWYRIGPFVFTTDNISHPDGNYRVFWLRYPLDKFMPGKKQRALLTKIRAFEITVHPLVITDELEQLFNLYCEEVDFQTSESLHKLLYDELHPGFVPPGLFNSQAVEIRDGDKLIAAGILDIGGNSSAGIVNFYDPAYKKYSLGKCLMLIKMGFSQSTGKQFYYPGYIAVDYPKFDYKLWAAKELAEIYDPVSRQWLPYSEKLLKDLAPHYPEQNNKADT